MVKTGVVLTEFAGLAKNRFRSYAVLDNRMWAIGGYCKSSGTNSPFSDIWYSQNGSEWTHFLYPENSCDRFFTSATVFKNRIWIIPSDPSKLWYIR